MKRLTPTPCSFEEAMGLLARIDTTTPYTRPVIFHAFWKGRLNRKHAYSIRSCVKHHNRPNYRVMLWLEREHDDQGEEDRALIAAFESLGVSIRRFDCASELERSGLGISAYSSPYVTFYSDFVRSLLLYNYGGCWFDLDFLFLRSFDPLFHAFGSEVCVYEWEKEPYPNNAIYFCLEPRSEKMEANIRKIAALNRGWGFQQARLTYDLPLDMLVLPCAWFDPGWIPNPYAFGWGCLFKQYRGEEPLVFFDGCFGYHWHNRWHEPIEPNCIVERLEQLSDP